MGKLRKGQRAGSCAERPGVDVEAVRKTGKWSRLARVAQSINTGASNKNTTSLLKNTHTHAHAHTHTHTHTRAHTFSGMA